MRIHASHSVVCRAPAARVHQLISRTEDWPAVLTPCEAVRVLRRDGRTELVEITARLHGRRMTWQSRRTVRPELLGVDAELLQPMPLVADMRTTWRVFALDAARCVLLLEHDYALCEEVRGLVEGVTTHAEAAEFIASAVDANSLAELADLRETAEASPSPVEAGSTATPDGSATSRDHAMRHSVLCGAPADAVYRVVRDTSLWPRLFEACTAADVVAGEGDVEVVRIGAVQQGRPVAWETRRHHLDGIHRVYYELPVPMPLLESMSGEWRVIPIGPRECLLTVDRRWRVLADVHGIQEGIDTPEQAAGTVAAFVHRNAEAEMQAILAFTETGEQPGTSELSPPAPRAQTLRPAPRAQTPRPARIPEAVFSAAGYFLPRLLFRSTRWAPQVHWGDIALALQDFPTDDLDLASARFWEEWRRRWTARGERHQVSAGTATTGAGRTRALRSAAACYHWAEFMYFDDLGEKLRLRTAVRDCFRRAMADSDLPIHHGVLEAQEYGGPVAVPYSLVLPPDAFRKPGPMPCVVVSNGLDSVTEVEPLSLAEAFLERGIAALLFDGPGQGIHAGQVPLQVDPEHVVSALLGRLRTDPRIDGTRLGFLGVSFGGHLALRIAQRLGSDLRCVVNFSGGPAIAPFAGLPRRLRDDFRVTLTGGPQDVSDQRLQERFDALRLDPAVPPGTQVLSVHGALDDIFPLAALEELDAAWGSRHVLVTHEREAHVCLNELDASVNTLADWAAGQLGLADARTEHHLPDPSGHTAPDPSSIAAPDPSLRSLPLAPSELGTPATSRP